LFLPLIAHNYERPMLMGTYTHNWQGDESTYTNEMTPFDTWTGKKHSLLGTFIDITPSSGYPADVTNQLTTIWNHGYTPFVNLMAVATTASQIADGSRDSSLNSWALAFKTYAEGGTGRAAFIAPLPEMNGSWTPYNGCDPSSPATVIAAYNRIRTRFAANGVPSASVRWVFAPNGYSDCGTIAEYYPGDAKVDVIGLSTYNPGFYPGYGTRWDDPGFTFGNYLPQLRAMSTAKPIIISQTGTTATTGSGRNDAAKNQWLIDAFNYLAGQSQVRGFIYYNTWHWEGIDWPVYGAQALILPPSGYTGYQTGAANPAYEYIAPVDLKNMPLLP
jgi:hypothetical protein